MIGNQIPDMLTTDGVALLMTVPIFDGGQREGRISERRSVVRQEAINTQDIQYQVTLEVRDALLTLNSAKEQVAVAEESLKLSLTELELARERFAVGVATNIEVTNAQTSVAQARDNLIQGLFNFNASRISLGAVARTVARHVAERDRALSPYDDTTTETRNSDGYLQATNFCDY